MHRIVRIMMALLLLNFPEETLDGTLTPPDITIPTTFFGMHIHRAKNAVWPGLEFGAWRLWDAHVRWPDLEPARGQWNFELLDAYLDLAETHHVDPLLVLGPSPTWASARPDESSPAGPGMAAEPKNIEDWRNYVRAIGTRYKGRIHEYEVWNEPNDLHSYSGSVEALVSLAHEAHEILSQIDPKNVIVSPSATSFDGVRWVDQFLSEGGADVVDVIGYHFYVNEYPPEKMVALIQQVESVMARHNVRKQLWCTETGWYKPKPFPLEMAPGYVSRAYILSWAAGVSRFFWYAWDNHSWVTLELTEGNSKSLKPAAIAYATTAKWLIGARLQSCEVDHSGIWVCKLARDDAANWVVWKESGEQEFTLPPSWHVRYSQSVLGIVGEIAQNRELSVGPLPILVH